MDLTIGGQVMTWICLHVNGFEWILHIAIGKLDTTNTCMMQIWSNWSGRQSKTMSNVNVLGHNILRAAVFGDWHVTVRWLNSNCIVIVGNVYVSNIDVRTSHVDSIGVQWEYGPRQLPIAAKDCLKWFDFILHEMFQEGVNEVSNSLIKCFVNICSGLWNSNLLSQHAHFNVEIVNWDGVNV